MSVAAEAKKFPLETRVEVMMVYADTLTRSRVMQIYQRLHQQLWREFDFDASWWKFDYFAHPQIADAATVAVATADLVFFAIKGEADLPGFIKGWLETWPARRQDRGKSLLALLEFSNQSSTTASPARSFLSGVAQRSQMDYMPYSTTDAVDLTAPAEPRVTSEIKPATAQRAPRASPIERWGLNE